MGERTRKYWRDLIRGKGEYGKSTTPSDYAAWAMERETKTRVAERVQFGNEGYG